MLEALQAERVEYVVIGGTAAAIGGASHVTFDLDITPDRGRANLDRLAAALRSINARPAGVAADVAASFQLDGPTLGNGSIWMTSAGSATSGPRSGSATSLPGSCTPSTRSTRRATASSLTATKWR
jgi:hypothetical protein